MSDLILVLIGYAIGQVLFLILMGPILNLYWTISDKLEDLAKEKASG